MATECSKCSAKYEKQGDKIPKLLPCWHTICLQCTEQLIQNCKLNCPECCTENIVPTGGFPTNLYLIENLEHANKVEKKIQRTVRPVEAGRHNIVPDYEVNMGEILKEFQASIHYRLEVEQAIVRGYDSRVNEAQTAMEGITLNPGFLPDTRATLQANNRGGPQGEDRNDAMCENAQRASDSEIGNERQRCCCCCHCCCCAENNVGGDHRQCERCSKVLLSVLKGLLMTFLYFISVAILLVICPIVLVFTVLISSLYVTAANLSIPFQDGNIEDTWKYYFKKCKDRIEIIYENCMDLLYNWFNYYDRLCNCQVCWKCCNGFYLVSLYFVLSITFTISFIGSLSLFIAGIAVVLVLLFVACVVKSWGDVLCCDF